MKHIAKLAVTALALSTAAGARASIPTIDDDSVSVTKRSSSLVIGYELKGAPAVVTVDFLTNGVSIGEANFANVDGDVNRLVAAGSRQITWKFRESWPDRKTDGFSVKLTAWPVNDPPDYLVVSYDSEQKTGVARYYVSTNALPYGGLANRLYATNNVVFRRIHAAGKDFTMKCYTAKSSSMDDARNDNRLIRLTRDYYLAIYETTGGHFRTLTGTEASGSLTQAAKYGGAVDEYPLCGYNSHSAIRWDDANTTQWPTGGHEGNPAKSCTIQTMRDRFGFKIDLPTEAEWEFACRAGTVTHYPFSGQMPANPTAADFDPWCWSSHNSISGPHPVGLLPPNAWGLYDMNGNVSEICLDFFDNTDGWMERMYEVPGGDSTDGRTDPMGVSRPTSALVSGKSQEQTRVKRGGCYLKESSWQRSGVRDFSYGGYDGKAPGMRLACPALAVR